MIFFPQSPTTPPRKSENLDCNRFHTSTNVCQHFSASLNKNQKNGTIPIRPEWDWNIYLHEWIQDVIGKCIGKYSHHIRNIRIPWMHISSKPLTATGAETAGVLIFSSNMPKVITPRSLSWKGFRTYLLRGIYKHLESMEEVPVFMQLDCCF